MKKPANKAQTINAGDRPIRLGTARRLTRASFVGESIETVPFLKYDLGY